MKRLIIIAVAVVSSGVLIYLLFPNSKVPVDYNTQVKPILNKRCISCHGGVKREAEFSLLFRQEALAPAESGKYPIVPGDVQKSELVRRITSHDPEERMPYKKDPLPQEEIDLLTRWIEEGANWGEHWAYRKVEQPALPSGNPWAKGPIDLFIYDKMKEAELAPSPEADKETLLRRASLDIIGIPAEEGLRASFINGEITYETLVDSLLASPHFGERWAAVWMDLARYADTKGYERDDGRNIWRYRDWLIRAFNRDMPYDSFLIEQLAGDLLPKPTDQQLIATAFHRNTMTNDEGGTDNEEFRTAAVLDRVNTTWEALMGTTFACVQCHSHPYDPFRHEDYYKFLAFFNNTRDEDTEADYPLLRHYESADQQKLSGILAWVEKNESKERAADVALLLKTWQPSINSILADQFTNSELSDGKWLIFRNNALCRLPNVDLNGKNQLIYRYANFVTGWWTIHLDKPDGPVLKSIKVPRVDDLMRFDQFLFEPVNGVHDLYFTYTSPDLKTPEASGMIFDWFYFTSEIVPQKGKESDLVRKDLWELLTNTKVATTPIMMENPPSMQRATHVFERGNWLVKGNEVEADVPATLSPMAAGAPKNRLGLAQWMTSKDHPLVSRTLVNRVWEQIFGTGLAETLEDLGTQGIPPTHPELLDHLSFQLMNDFNWSVKKLIREIALSATYRQDSKITPEQQQKDPLNKFYARAPRVRLSAEQVRDQALAVSGLLSRKMYGPSVMPYQPNGIWLSPWSGAYWERSKGEDQYRRGLYTYWKRTAPYPSMMTFDGSAREVCTARRIRTNTPLQALVTLNDSVFVEASYQLASRMKKKSEKVEEQIRFGYRESLGHDPKPEAVQALLRLYEESKKLKIASVKNQEPTEKQHENEALMLVANAIMNLNEFVTKN